MFPNLSKIRRLPRHPREHHLLVLIGTFNTSQFKLIHHHHHRHHPQKVFGLVIKVVMNSWLCIFVKTNTFTKDLIFLFLSSCAHLYRFIRLHVFTNNNELFHFFHPGLSISICPSRTYIFDSIMPFDIFTCDR